MRRRTAIWWSAIVLSGCTRTVEPPAPPLDTAEPLVADRIREATTVVRSDPTSAASWGRLGEIYDIHRFAEPALVCYAEAERLAPDDWRWPYFAGIVLRESDRTRSLEALERARKLETAYAPLHVYIGLAALAADDLDRAQASFEEALKLDPTSVNAGIGLARVDLARGNPEAARDRLTELARSAPDEAAVHHHLSQAYRALGDERRADRERRIAESARLPLQAGNLATLPDPVREDVILAEGASTSWLIANSQRLLARGRQDEAAAMIENALRTAPESTTALLAGARVYGALGQGDRALALVQRAVELEPANATGYLELGHLFVRANQPENAIKAFERALELDPQLPEAKSNLATLYFQAGREKQGVELLRVASKELPANLDIQYNLAATLMMSGDTKEAREVLIEALDVDPTHVPSRHLLGMAQATDGKYDDAVASFRAVLEQDPDNLESRLDLGRALWETGSYGESIDALRRAAQLAPSDPEIAREVAWSLAVCPDDEFRSGQEALAIAQALVQQGGGRDPRYLDLLAAAQAETGDFNAAVSTGDHAIRIIQRTLAARRQTGPKDRIVMMQDFLLQLSARVDGYRRGRPYRDRG